MSNSFAALLVACCATVVTAGEGRHWSLRPLARPAVPGISDEDRVASPVDAFLLARLRGAELSPSPLARRRALVRRLAFDLTGLPPSPDEVAEFLADSRPDAYTRLVDRLLASPHYGERWGRHWLDVVRYADTGGFEVDQPYSKAWRYRDWVIRAFNEDKPFDHFVQEQVAGDELWPDDEDAIVATGVFSIGPVMVESALTEGLLEYEHLTDCVDTLGAAFLGTTLGCARCHDHKFDDFTQRDYFALQAVFAASDRVFSKKTRELRIRAINDIRSEGPLPEELENEPRCRIRTDADRPMRLFHLDTPDEVRLLDRGDLGKPTDLVIDPGVPAALPASDASRDPSVASRTTRRAALARWLTSSRDNPLVPRVMANRVWAWHFGRGLVATPSDFGHQGEPPTHPELLEWLASRLVEGGPSGWSVKRLHRDMVLSRAYRMSSVATARGREVDPDNRLLWRFRRRRLEAEEIRDAILWCSGTLSLENYGPPAVPALSPEELVGLFDVKKWPVSEDPLEHTRRGVYLFVKRAFRLPFFEAFDLPEVMTSCARRHTTTVPAQALTLLNSPLIARQAAAFARRVRRERERSPDDDSRIIGRAWMLAFARPITSVEHDRVRAFLEKHSLVELCLALFNTNEFITID